MNFGEISNYLQGENLWEKKLGVIFGGTSTEHDVSIVSGTSVIKNLNKEKYDIYPIYIDKKENGLNIQIITRNIKLEMK